MALEFGSGTQADPYLLVNLADVTAWLTTHHTQGYWFALVADLDVSGSIINNSTGVWKWNINGRGFSLKIKMKSTSIAVGGLTNCNLIDVYLAISFPSNSALFNSFNGYLILDNAVISFTNVLDSAVRSYVGGSNGILIDTGNRIACIPSSNIFKHGPAVANTINTSGFPDGNPFNRVNYPTFVEGKWFFDGVSLPRPRPQSTEDLTTRYGVKGQTKVGGSNRQRNLAVFTENGLRYKVQDTKADGSFFLNLNDVSTPVIVLAYDDIGAKAAINTAYSLNQIIHPAIPNGFRYRCTLAGNSGATIPSEPWPTSVVLTIGAAKFTPEPVYEPKAHGPLLPVLFNVITEQPV